MASDAISFFRVGRGGLTAEMRRHRRAWKKLVVEFGESVCHRPSGGQEQLPVRGERLKTDGMLTVGVLFAVLLGMLPKEEPMLQRLVRRHVFKLSISIWRHVGAMS